MELKLYQMQILAGAALAALMQALVLTSPSWLLGGVVEALEAASFVLCCTGVVTGGRQLGAMFETLGRDKIAARGDPNYMRARRRLQMTSVVGVAAIGLLAARRSSVSWIYPVAGAAVLGMTLPILDRMWGWGRSD